MPLSAQYISLFSAGIHRFLSFLLPVICLMVVSVTAMARPVLDPVDGPHVDLKLSLDEDALRMQALACPS